MKYVGYSYEIAITVAKKIRVYILKKVVKCGIEPCAKKSTT